MPHAADQRTADRFAQSWNDVYDASVYTREQFLDWIAPWNDSTVRGKSVLELGCGSGALLIHMSSLGPSRLAAVDLGSSTDRAEALLAGTGTEIRQMDLTDGAAVAAALGTFDCVYSIGVIHHLTSPEKGVESLLSLTRPGGRFHGWVYAHEGNAVVRWFVDPLRRVASLLPFPVVKWGLALPLSIPFFLFSKVCRRLTAMHVCPPLPMRSYMLWIAQRGFRFHHHVACDQLVTPVTCYVRRERVEAWLRDSRIEPGTAYVICRNGNGWKFGGVRCS